MHSTSQIIYKSKDKKKWLTDNLEQVPVRAERDVTASGLELLEAEQHTLANSVRGGQERVAGALFSKSALLGAARMRNHSGKLGQHDLVHPLCDSKPQH